MTVDFPFGRRAKPSLIHIHKKSRPLFWGCDFLCNGKEGRKEEGRGLKERIENVWWFKYNVVPLWSYGLRSSVQLSMHTTIQVHHTTIQVHHTTSKEQAKNKRLKKFLMAIGENGANLKALMDDMDLRNRSSFVNTYIAPNLAEGYIAMLSRLVGS